MSAENSTAAPAAFVSGGSANNAQAHQQYFLSNTIEYMAPNPSFAIAQFGSAPLNNGERADYEAVKRELILANYKRKLAETRLASVKELNCAAEATIADLSSKNSMLLLNQQQSDSANRNLSNQLLEAHALLHAANARANAGKPHANGARDHYPGPHPGRKTGDVDEILGLRIAKAMYGAEAEKTLLLQTIERKDYEIASLRHAIQGKKCGHSASACWQASVDEAIARERFKDAWVIRALREEIEGLKGGRVQRGMKLIEGGDDGETESFEEGGMKMIEAGPGGA